MIEIRPLGSFDVADMRRVMTGYTTAEIYHVTYTDSESSSYFSIELASLPQPYVHGGNTDHLDAEILGIYQQAAREGFSFGAYEDGVLVGFLIAEARHWNNTLWVWEYHVAEGYRRRGLGSGMMERAAAAASAAGLRAIVCETQNINAPAIHAYRRMGFRAEGIDISYYTNEDYPDPSTGIAVFMKRRL